MVMQEYERWITQELDDADLKVELEQIKEQPDAINDRFYRELTFGTGGLRGVIGAGTNRMNVYTVRKATQGLANYLLKGNRTGKSLSVAIAYDSRNKGVLFAEQSAAVLAANGIHAYIYTKLMPTPALSFAVRDLNCDAGICVTASHNPAEYNGYKAYGSDGCQITSAMADGVTEEISALDLFSDVKALHFEEGLEQGTISYIPKEVEMRFLDAVYQESLKGTADNIDVVYTPLNGSGKDCVLQILARLGVRSVHVVPEQSEPDGNFPTCPYPNPEFKETLQKGIDLAEKMQADLLIATDPDCDRVGIAVNQGGSFQLMSGNEVGILMLDYIARIRTEKGTMPSCPLAVTTIVSTDMLDPIAEKFGIEIRRVLTGFKYIGDIIAELEAENREDAFLLGFEESYGYLTGSYVRDKDAVNGSMMICEMASYYKARGQTLADAMEALYETYGYYINETCNFTFKGEDGMKTMSGIMEGLRRNPPVELAGLSVTVINDYKASIQYSEGTERPILLPKSDVLEYHLTGGNKFTVRPSGTEPKIKVYLSAKGTTKAKAGQVIDAMKQATKHIIPL